MNKYDYYHNTLNFTNKRIEVVSQEIGQSHKRIKRLEELTRLNNELISRLIKLEEWETIALYSNINTQIIEEIEKLSNSLDENFCKLDDLERQRDQLENIINEYY